jgi:hypothetical protein
MAVDNYIREKDTVVTCSKFGPMLIQKSASQMIHFTYR